MIEWYKNTAWHKWWVENVWKPSWTKIVTALYGIPAALTLVGELAAKFLNDSTIQGYLNRFDIPNWVPMVAASLALVHYIASGRD